jgi:hypothetical protein
MNGMAESRAAASRNGGIAGGSVAEWNRERQRRGMESRAAASRNGGMAGGSVAEWNNIPKNYYI